MNLWRRIVGLSLSAVMALSMLTPAAHAEETEPAVTEEMSVVQLAEEQQGEDAVLTEQAEMAEEEPALPEEQPTEAEESADPTEEEPAEAEEIAAVRVSFVCEPEELTLTVYPAVSFGEREAIQPEEDGTYLLMPGDYLYTAECELWETAENVEFTVEQGEENVEIDIKLEATEELLIELFGGNEEIITFETARYGVLNTKNATGNDILNEARKWYGTNAVYWSDVTPWVESVYWRTGYTYKGQTSFDCSGFIGRVLNDAGFRSLSYNPPYGECILSERYGSNFIGISIEELINYGTDINAAVKNAKNGDYSGLLPGDIIGWTSGSLGRHAIIYAGINSNGKPSMIEWTGSGYYERAITAEYQSNFAYGARFTSEELSYLSKCTYYPCYVQITPANGSHQIWSLPCSDQTDSNSKVIASATGTLTAIALYKNSVTSSDHYWYKVKLSNGSEGYVYAPYCNVTTVNTTIQNGLTYKWDDIPSTLTVGNDGCPVNCTVYSQYADISTITGTIGTYKGIENYGQQDRVRERNLNYTPVDSGMRFDAITEPGSYPLTISILVKNYYCTSKTNTLKSETVSKAVVDRTVTYVASGSSTGSGQNGQYAWFPAPTMNLTQLAYEDYSHGAQNAIDIAPGGNVFAPFTGKIAYTDSNWGYVTLQSLEKVHWADGTYDYMTVGFMHDSDISDLYVGKVISQGEAFYQAGGMGNGNPNAYGAHVHITVHKGLVTRGTPYGNGDQFAYNAFYINSEKTTSVVQKGKAQNPVLNNAPTNYSDLWKYLNGASAGSYVNRCERYDTYLTVKINTTTTIKTQPCSGGTDASSKNVRVPSIGEILTVTGIYKNTVGNYWYEIYDSGQTCYVFAGDTDTLGYRVDDVTISNIAAPAALNVGQRFSIKGDIKANYNLICTVICYINTGFNSDIDSTQVLRVKDEPWVKSYSLLNSPIDMGATFNTLEKNQYTYRIVAVCPGYYSADGHTMQKFWGSTELVRQNFTVGYGQETAHSWDSGKVTKAATCTATGVKTYTCTGCGATKTETIPATGHSWDSGKVTKAATCTATGVKTYTCTKCGETKTETIAKKGHTVVEDPAVAATCTAAGKTAGSHCSVCNAVITAQTTVQATGHSWDSGTVTKAATCTATGVKTYTCTVCGATKTETIAKKGHNYVATVTPPTATEQGYTTHICSRCGDKYIDSFVDPTGNSETLKSDFITRLYNVCLGRNPSAQDLADSITQLKNGTTGAQKAYQFIFSDEFKAKNYCDEHYVRALYKAFMGREASADEAASWVWRLQQGDSRETVFNYFANCAEFGAICSGAGITQGKASYSGSTKQGGYCSATGCTAYKQKVEFVTRLYNVCLDRNPNQSEKDAWHYYFVHGDHTGSSASEYFLTSKEFKAHNYNNADFIKHVFSAMLGRAPSESELSSWEYNMWANNKSRVSVIREFTKFDEFKAICQQYGIVHS